MARNLKYMQDNYQLNSLEERISKLENQQKEDYREIIENNKQLAVIVGELKTITKSMEDLANNWKDTINANDERRKEERLEIVRRIDFLEKKVSSLNDKVDNRTVGKSSKLWEDSKWIIISGIISAVVAMIISNIIK